MVHFKDFWFRGSFLPSIFHLTMDIGNVRVESLCPGNVDLTVVIDKRRRVPEYRLRESR